jgi:bifunctional UDP-N-acetylglucosamine pyrophosphorylase/glucosamine-1-phosphate N-acetyltransferase
MPATPRRLVAVILAAGEGTRMRSALPKVLHPVAGRPMLGHVILAAEAAERVIVVVGPGRDDVAAYARSMRSDVIVCVQTERKGTAHAVLAAESAIGEAVEAGIEDCIILFADTPLVTAMTLAGLRAALASGCTIAALGFEASDPAGYGRFLMDGDTLSAIREHKDATEAERAVSLCNAGLMAVAAQKALPLLKRVTNNNAQQEYYLTELIALARADGDNTAAVIADEAEVMGVNDRIQLAQAETAMQSRLREKAMRDGATLIAPETVYFWADTSVGRDVMIEPHVVFGPNVTIADNVTIHAFSHIEGATIGNAAQIGPFARIRPGSEIGARGKVGNFVETKNAKIGFGAKVNHLSYIGDASVGADANIGAGTITCNYDGFGKYRTEIGAGAFIGSNSSLVAPVKIADGAYVGSGSVITEDVPADALAVARGRQIIRDGWAKRFRASKGKDKA